ncbi:MAG: hypothetical protein IKZ46_12830 [Victivallales bacterium]|nr:hypothetical protein [Victivallales bacterium]
MNPLLRKIFFWDEPEQGAFFGLTLLLLTLWSAFSVFCACVAAYSRIFTFTAVAVTFFSWLILSCLYSLFLVIKGVVYIIKQTPRFWMRLLKMLAAVAVLTPLCTALVYNLLSDPPITAVLAILTAFCLAFFGSVYLFRPIVPPAKLLSCLLSWTGAFLVFSTLFCLANPLEDRVPHEFNRCPEWLGQDIPYVVPFWRWFGLSGKGCFWFTLAGFLMLAIAYLLTWCILAKLSGVSMRRFCGRDIRVQWAIMAGIYVVTLCFALGSNAQYRTSVKALEMHFGYPMTGAGLGQIYYDGQAPDAAYWKRLDASLERYDQEQKKTEDNGECTFDAYPDAVLPKELYEKRRTSFLNSLKTAGLQQYYVSPMPPDEKDFSAKYLYGMPLPELSECRKLARIEQRRCQYAIDSGDFNTAAQCIAHLDILCDFLSRDCFHIAFLIWRQVGLIRNEMLAKLLASGLPTDKWLEEQTNQLLHWEKSFEQKEKMILYSQAIINLELLQLVVGEHLTEWKAYDFNGNWNYWLYFKSIRFSFPQGWWLAAKSARDCARVMKVTSFEQLPQKATGSVLADRMISSLSRTSQKKRSYIASCRVLRGLIAVEQLKRRTGVYPDSPNDLPADPFTNQPLKYRKGQCEVRRYYAKWLPGETEEGAEDVEPSQNGEWTLEDKTETVEAVQIWSIGPDGIDDGGLDVVKEEGSDVWQRTDDIRFLLPIP